MRFIQTPLPGAWVIELGAAQRRARLVRPHVRRRGVRRARPEPGGRAVQRVVQRAPRHAARHALPGRAARRVQARALRARGDLRRGRRPAPGLAHLLPLARRGAERRERVAPTTSPRASRTASRRSPTTARCSTRWATATCPRRRAACAATTPRSRSSGPQPDGERDRSPSRTAPTRTSRREPRAAHRRQRLRRAPRAHRAEPTPVTRCMRWRADRGARTLRGVIWHEADLLAEAQRESSARSSPRFSCTSRGTPSTASSGPRRENVRWVEASLALLQAFADAGGRRAVMAGTCAEYEWSRELLPRGRAAAPRHAVRRRQARPAHGRSGVRRAGRAVAGMGAPVLPVRARRGAAALRARRWRVRCSPASRAPMTAGTQRRDFMHVADAGAAFAALADCDLQGAVNIASRRRRRAARARAR